jgi:OFA family oxalate/formate antiporter-like MFS transporter
VGRLFHPSNYGWIILASCLIFIAITYGIRFSFGIFFQSFEQEFNWSRALTSGVFSIYMLVGALFAVLGGWIADRRGAKVVFIVMGFMAFVGLALTSRANTLWQVLLSYSFIFAAGSGPTYALATSLTTRWFKNRRALALAFVTSGVGIGSIVMAPTSSYLIEGFGWRFAFLITGFIALIMAPFAFLLKRAPNEGKSSDEDNQYKAVKTGVSPVSNNNNGGFSLAQAARTRNFWLLIIMWIFYAICVFMIYTHIVRHAIDIGINTIQAASILSIIGFANIPGRIISGMLSDRYSRKAVAIISASFMVASLIWLTQSTNLWMLYIFAIVFGAAYGGIAPPTSSIVGDAFGMRNIGTIFGVLEVGWVSGAAAGPALAGFIYDTTGTYSLAFWLVVAAGCIIIALLSFLKVPAISK